MNCPEVILFASDCHSIAMIQTGYLEVQRDRKNCGLPTRSCLPRLIYHRRALSKDLLLRAVTGTSFFTTGGESRIQSFSETRRAAPSLCDGSVDSRAIVLKTRLSFLKPTRFTFSASIFRRATNQPAIQTEVLTSSRKKSFDTGATIWRTTAHQVVSHGEIRVDLNCSLTKSHRRSSVALHASVTP